MAFTYGKHVQLTDIHTSLKRLLKNNPNSMPKRDLVKGNENKAKLGNSIKDF